MATQITLPPQLQSLMTAFNQIIDEYEANRISYEQATSSVKYLVTVDRQGDEWRITADGVFTCNTPGEQDQAVVRDPAEFQPAASHPGQDTFSAPAGHGGAPLPPLVPAQPGPAAPATSAEDYRVAPVTAPTPKRGKAQPDQGRAVSTKPAGPGIGQRAAEILGSVDWRALLRGRARLVVVAVVCLGILLYGTHVLGASNDTAGSIPSIGTAAAPGNTSGDSRVPTGDRISALFSAVTSGKRPVARAAVANPGDDVRVATAVGELAGYVSTGLQVSAGKPAAESGAAVADVRLVDKVSQKTYATAKVHFTVKDGKWLFADWPDFVRS